MIVRNTLIFCILLITSSCQRKNNTHYLEMIQQQEWKFPDDWLGNWKGNLLIYDQQGLQQSIPMMLDLHEVKDSSGVYHWGIIYGEDQEEGRRDYYLSANDRSTGHYLIDEQNGIFIDAYHRGNCLMSSFEVSGNLIVSTYERNFDHLTFEIIMAHTKGEITGDTIVNGQQIPTVTSFPGKIRQVAQLHRFSN